MRLFISLLIITTFCGCSFIMNENENMKTIGIRKDDATKLTDNIDKQRPDNLSEIKIMQKKEAVQEEPAPVMRRIK